MKSDDALVAKYIVYISAFVLAAVSTGMLYGAVKTLVNLGQYALMVDLVLGTFGIWLSWRAFRRMVR